MMRITSITNRAMQASNKSNGPVKTKRVHKITANDLPLHCPTKEMSLWNAHPRVYLPIEDNGEAVCPYCGTIFKMAEPVSVTGEDNADN